MGGWSVSSGVSWDTYHPMLDAEFHWGGKGRIDLAEWGFGFYLLRAHAWFSVWRYGATAPGPTMTGAHEVG